MKLKKNELKIIQLLLASPDYISTYDIATSTGIPRRLVRDEISNVRVILSSLNLNLLSKPSKGYFIEGKSSKDLSRLQNIINDNGTRTAQICLKLLQFDEHTAMSQYESDPVNAS